MVECWSMFFHPRCWLWKWLLLKRLMGGEFSERRREKLEPIDQSDIFQSECLINHCLFQTQLTKSWPTFQKLGVKPKRVRILSMTQPWLSQRDCRADQPIEWRGKRTPDILVTLDFAELDSGPNLTHLRLKIWMSGECFAAPDRVGDRHSSKTWEMRTLHGASEHEWLFVSLCELWPLKSWDWLQCSYDGEWRRRSNRK